MKKRHPVPPHRAVEVVFEVRQPRGGLDERHSGAGFGPREAYTVRRSDISNGLSDSAEAFSSSLRRGPVESGTFVPEEHAQL